MKTIFNHILKRTVIALVLLTLTAVSALSADRATIDISAIAEVTSITAEKYVPLTTRNTALTLEWRNTPMTASALAAYFNRYLSAHGVTATAYVPSTSMAQVSLSRPSSANGNLDIVIKDYAGEKTIHWFRPEDILTADRNWIETRTFHGTGEYDYHSDVTYYNGLGLPEMHVSGAASGNGKSIVTPVAYDDCLRAESVVPLPFESADVSLKMVPEADASQAYGALYGADAEYAFTARTFDSYSLNRPVSTVMPGVVGRDRTKASAVEYGLSTAADKVLNIRYDETTSAINVSAAPAFLSGLEKTVCRDENGKVVIRFSDHMGREVLSRQPDGTDETCGLDTYTVYDLAGRPVWVISPKGSELLESASSFASTSALATAYSTIYRYDSYGRMSERKQPGRGKEYYIYDSGDRLVLYQDGNLRASNNRWIYTVYDRFGREIEKTVVLPVNPAMSEQQIRGLISGMHYTYPELNGVTDYRIPVSRQVFACDRQLSSVRYGGQTYRTGVTSATSVSVFTVPSYLSFAEVSGVALSSDVCSADDHMKVYEKLWILGDVSAMDAVSTYIERAYYYDIFGRVVQTVERDPWGGISRTSVKYDRQGNVLARKESRNLPAAASSPESVVKATTCSYDSRGRMISESTEVIGTGDGTGNMAARVMYSYDGLGRLRSITTGDGAYTERTYTTQGWQSGMTVTDSLDAPVFSQDLSYQECGFISGVTSRQGSADALSFGVTYDRAGRMTSWKQAESNAFAEKDITYDANGNILTLKRYGEDAGEADNYSYIYDGNKLTGVFKGIYPIPEITYDSNGNMTSDGRSLIASVAYNELNLPQSVTFTGGEADYLYLSDGTKLAALKDGSGLIYCGSMVFSCSFSGTAPAVDFESTGFSAGRMVKKDGAVQPEYHVNDYLCSVRVVTDADGEVLERNDYSGFGKRLASSAVTPAAGSANRYRFSGKEEQSFAGVPWQDFGARMYDPDLARWTTPDPLAEKYPGISPYVYCNDNPVNFVDQDGKAIDLIADVVSIGCGIYNLAQNIKAGNTKAAWGDVAGIGLDLVCAVIPGVTINAGTAKTLAKSSLEIADKVVDAKGAWSLNPFDRGKSIEKTLHGWGDNYPVIDFYNEGTKTATSIKSLDLNAKSYKSGNAVFNRVKGYIDDLVKFEGKMTTKHPVPEGGIESRVLELAIPEGATQSQQDQLKRLIDYAQQNNVQLNIVLAK